MMFMEHHQSLVITFFGLLGYVLSDGDMCYENKSWVSNDEVHYHTRYYCCRTNNIITENGKCRKCSTGYKASMDTTCIPCDNKTYGEKCVQKCLCNNMQICNHITGCINEFKSTDAGERSQYTKGTEWSDNFTTDVVNTSFRIVKSSQTFSTNRPDLKQQKESSSLSSHLIIYVACTGCLALFIGLSILFRQYCYRHTNVLCWKTKDIVEIENHRNSNYDDEFQEEIFELERHGSIYDLIDEQNMVENIEHLQDDIPIGPDNIYEFAFD